MIIAFVVLGSVGVFFNGAAAVMFVYAAAGVGRFASRARAQRWLIGMTVIMVGLFVVSAIPLLYRVASFAFPLAFVWIVGHQVIEAVERERKAAQLRVDSACAERLARDALAEVRAAVSGWRHHALDVEFDAARDALAARRVRGCTPQAGSPTPPMCGC